MIKFFKAIGKFFKDLFTDFEDHWDLKPILGFAAFVFGFYFLGWLKGDLQSFLAIEAIAAFLLGWAASPWGAGDPRPNRMLQVTSVTHVDMDGEKTTEPNTDIAATSASPTKDGA